MKSKMSAHEFEIMYDKYKNLMNKVFNYFSYSFEIENDNGSSENIEMTTKNISFSKTFRFPNQRISLQKSRRSTGL